MTQKEQSYGTWPSPISPQMLASSLRLNDVQWDSDGQTVVWLENRGATGTLVALDHGASAARDLTDASQSVSGRVGYGGGEFTVSQGQVIYSAGGRLRRVSIKGGRSKQISPGFGAAAAPSLSADGKWVAFVHSYENVDGIALVDSEGTLWPQKLAYGDDFAMQPTWHPQGTHIAYIAWNHPQMPWNGTELRLITMAYNKQGVPYAAVVETLAGGKDNAIFQPQFSPDGRYLAYISDESGQGQIHLHDLAEGTHEAISEGEINYIIPAWIQGMRTYGWTGDSAAIYAIGSHKAVDHLYALDIAHKSNLPIHDLMPYTSLSQISIAPNGERIALIGSAARMAPRILSYSAQEGVRTLRYSVASSVMTEELADVQPIEWPARDGETVYGLHYAPHNPGFTGIGKPPLMVLIHGGPTSQSTASYSGQAQFFATRGFGVLLVNHRGSTGYGKAYMNKHEDNWGVYDVLDSVDGAQYLIDQGQADPGRIIIMGGSAGGYTVLQSMVDVPGFYKAGIAMYGIADQFALVRDTHKFEAHYSDWLLGTLPEAAERYHDRSPIFHADKIRDALAVFQGEDDKVVPRNQSDMIVEALKRGSVPHIYQVYAGEGHGWRKPDTIKDFYERVLDFITTHVLYT